MISPRRLATKLLYDVSQWWTPYLNRCMVDSASEVVEALGGSVPFSLEPRLVEMEGRRYTSPILPVSLAELVLGRRSAGGVAPKSGGGSSNGGGTGGTGGTGDGGSGGGGNKKTSPKVDAMGGDARVRARYDVHLPSLSLHDGENSRSILAGAVLPTLHGHVLCKNWNLCGVCWEDCKCKNLHVPTPPEVATTIAGLLKVARGGMIGVPAA